jgi:hypothetical protein
MEVQLPWPVRLRVEHCCIQGQTDVIISSDSVPHCLHVIMDFSSACFSWFRSCFTDRQSSVFISRTLFSYVLEPGVFTCCTLEDLS